MCKLHIHMLNVNRILCNFMPHEEIDTNHTRPGRPEDGATANRRLEIFRAILRRMEGQARRSAKPLGGDSPTSGDRVAGRQIITRAEAKAASLPRYFTGKPCKHGHVAERYTSIKICVSC